MDCSDKPLRMPWPVQAAKWWFVLLAVASCVPFVRIVFSICCGAQDLLDEMLAVGIVGFLALAALGFGFVRGVCKGPRRWVAVPYLLIGCFPFSATCARLLQDEVTPVALAWLVSVAIATILPVGLLYLPASNRWYAAICPRKKSGIDCALMVTLVVLGLMFVSFLCSLVCTLWTPNVHEVAMTGRVAFIELLTKNERARIEGRAWVDPAACSNSIEYVEKLCVLFDAKHSCDAGKIGHRWAFAANFPDDAPDTFPVMMNISPQVVPKEWDGETGGDERVAVDVWPGNGMKSAVIIRKGGALQVLKRKHATRKAILGVQPYRLGEGFHYLTPNGRIP